jgi:hypothetical protein
LPRRRFTPVVFVTGLPFVAASDFRLKELREFLEGIVRAGFDLLLEAGTSLFRYRRAFRDGRDAINRGVLPASFVHAMDHAQHARDA